MGDQSGKVTRAPITPQHAHSAEPNSHPGNPTPNTAHQNAETEPSISERKTVPRPARKSNAQDVTKHSRRTTHSPHTAQRNAKRQPKQGDADSEKAPTEEQQVKPAQYAIPHSLQTPLQPSTAPAHAGKKPNVNPTENSCANGEQKTPNRTPSAANGKTASSTDSAHAVGANNTPKKRKPKPKPTAKHTAHQRTSECADG